MPNSQLPLFVAAVPQIVAIHNRVATFSHEITFIYMYIFVFLPRHENCSIHYLLMLLCMLLGLFNMNAGPLLRDIRKQLGLSIQTVVHQSNGLLDKTTISRIEKGERRLSLKAAYAFSKVYKIDLGVLAEKTLSYRIENNDFPFSLESDERSLIEMFRLMPKDRRRIMLQMAMTLSEASDIDTLLKTRKKVHESLRLIKGS